MMRLVDWSTAYAARARTWILNGRWRAVSRYAINARFLEVVRCRDEKNARAVAEIHNNSSRGLGIF
jgi:hypothetical protein